MQDNNGQTRQHQHPCGKTGGTRGSSPPFQEAQDGCDDHTGGGQSKREPHEGSLTIPYVRQRTGRNKKRADGGSDMDAGIAARSLQP